MTELVIPPWSFSTISSYETCPQKYYAAKVSKQFPDPANEASLWGSRVHTALENRLRNGDPLPEGMDQWEVLCALFDTPKGTLLIEQKFALDANFEPTDWDTAWVRGIIDVGVLKKKSASAYDWKTGKVKPSTLQMKLFAAGLMHTYPDIDKVTTGYIWLQDGSITSAVYTRDDLPDIWGEFIPKVVRWERSFKRDEWEARPSGLCRGWCSNKICPHYRDKK